MASNVPTVYELYCLDRSIVPIKAYTYWQMSLCIPPILSILINTPRSFAGRLISTPDTHETVDIYTAHSSQSSNFHNTEAIDKIPLYSSPNVIGLHASAEIDYNNQHMSYIREHFPNWSSLSKTRKG